MGPHSWLKKHSMRDPVRGEFRPSDSYYPHPGRVPIQQMLTGVVTADGMEPFAAEVLDDLSRGRGIGRDVLPVLFDRSDPTKIIVLWDELSKPDFRAEARKAAEADAAAARDRSAQPAATGTPSQPIVTDASVQETPPEWATQLIAGLVRDGKLPATAASAPTVIDGGTQIIDTTSGHLSAAEAADLLRTGTPATATLTAVQEVSVPQVALPGPTASLCDLTLTVHGADGGSYTAQTRLGFRDHERRARIAVIGSVLPVRVDPADPQRVAVDSNALG